MVFGSLRLRPVTLPWEAVISYWKLGNAGLHMSASARQNPLWPAMPLKEAHARLTAPGSRFEMEEVVIRGVPTRCWKQAPPTLRDVLAVARLYGDRDFLVYENE